MTDYTFKSSSTQNVKWDDPSSWQGGVVPEGSTADVKFPLVTYVATGTPYLSSVSIQSNESYSVHSVDLNDNLVIGGQLSVTGGITAEHGGIDVRGGMLDVDGTLSTATGTHISFENGTLSAQTLDLGQGSSVTGNGTVTTTTLHNAGTIGDNLNIQATSFTNSGTIGASNQQVHSFSINATVFTNTGTISEPGTITTSAGGFSNLVNGTLSGGHYNLGSGPSGLSNQTLAINAGESISSLAADVKLQNGAVITSFDPATGQNLSLTDTLHTIASTGSLNIDVGSGSNPGDHVLTFGSLDVAGTLSVENGTLAYSHLTVADGGTLNASQLDMNSSIENDGTVIANVLRMNGDITGTGHIDVPGNGYLELNGATSETITLADSTGYFVDDANLQLDKPSSFTGSIAASGHNDRIILSNISYKSITSYSYVGDSKGGTLTLQEQGGASNALKFVGDFKTSDFTLSAAPQTFSTDPQQLLITVNAAHPVCFLAGTAILTPGGEVAVERLRVGDLVVTAAGEHEAVVWLGSGRSHGQPGARAVVVRAGALADGIPARDLRMTEGHSLYLDGVLIPVAALINGRSIDWDDSMDGTDFYHVELATHDAILAEGAAAESYRDDGNRQAFAARAGTAATGASAPFAPVTSSGPIVDAAWRRLCARAGATPTLTDDPDLHLLVDGVRFDPIEVAGGTYRFACAQAARSIVIASRAVVPATAGIARDQRQLGVAVRSVSMSVPGHAISLDYAADALDAGFHEAEHRGALRWTDGAASLPLPPQAGSAGFGVDLAIASFARYAV